MFDCLFVYFQWDDYYEQISSKENPNFSAYQMSRRRAKAINMSRNSTVELTSISRQRSNSHEEVKQTRQSWRDIIQAKRYHRNNGSRTCSLQ